MSEPIYGARETALYDISFGIALERDTDGMVKHYTELALAGADRVLELGCGTGRVLLPLANSTGLECVGVDPSEEMLEVFASKPGADSIRLVRASMQSFDLGAYPQKWSARPRFGLIYSAYSPFRYLITVEEQVAALRCVRRHLLPHGVFAFDVDNVMIDPNSPTEIPEHEDMRFAIGDDDQVVQVSRCTTDPATQRLSCRTTYTRYHGRTPDLGPLAVVESFQVDHETRWFYALELQHLLARVGFGRVDIAGDFKGAPVGHQYGRLVVVAR